MNVTMQEENLVTLLEKGKHDAFEIEDCLDHRCLNLGDIAKRAFKKNRNRHYRVE